MNENKFNDAVLGPVSEDGNRYCLLRNEEGKTDLWKNVIIDNETGEIIEGEKVQEFNFQFYEKEQEKIPHIYINKLPPTITAIKYTGSNSDQIQSFLGDEFNVKGFDKKESEEDFNDLLGNPLLINYINDGTLMTISEGNYLCQEIAEEPNVFILPEDTFNRLFNKYTG